MSAQSGTSLLQLAQIDPSGEGEKASGGPRYINLDSYNPPAHHLPHQPSAMPEFMPQSYDTHNYTPSGPSFDQSRYIPPPRPHQLNEIHSCIDVAYHVKECPICAKVYSCEKNYLIVAIIVLLIIVGLLIKHIMDQPRRVS